MLWLPQKSLHRSSHIGDITPKGQFHTIQANQKETSSSRYHIMRMNLWNKDQHSSSQDVEKMICHQQSFRFVYWLFLGIPCACFFFLPSSSMKEPCFFERSPPRTLVSNRSSGDLSACKNLADSSDIRNIDMWYECRLLKHAKAARYDTMFLIYGIWAVNLIIVVNLIHLFLYILLQHNLQFHVKPNVPERVWSRPLHPPTPKWKDLDLFKRNVGQGIR